MSTNVEKDEKVEKLTILLSKSENRNSATSFTQTHRRFTAIDFHERTHNSQTRHRPYHTLPDPTLPPFIPMFHAERAGIRSWSFELEVGDLLLLQLLLLKFENVYRNNI